MQKYIKPFFSVAANLPIEFLKHDFPKNAKDLTAKLCKHLM